MNCNCSRKREPFSTILQFAYCRLTNPRSFEHFRGIREGGRVVRSCERNLAIPLQLFFSKQYTGSRLMPVAVALDLQHP
eukprot:3706751-Amphidinium_carterae.1